MKTTERDCAQRIALLVVAVAGAAAPAIAGPPGFRALGFLNDEGFGPSLAYGISADGRVVVGEALAPDGFEAFRWTADGGMVGLGDLPGGAFSSSAYGCSADGSVIGGSSDDGSAGEGGTPFMWTKEGGMQWLGTLGGPTTYGQARGVSADGSVIVGASQSPEGFEAFRWTKDTGIVSIGDLPGGGVSAGAVGISGDGLRIAGSGTNDMNSDRAFLWTQEGGMVQIGEGFSFGLGISQDGSTVVGIDSGRAFYWNQAEGLVRLPPFQDEPFNYYAMAVSGDGSVIVGLANLNQGQGTGEAFIWDAQHGMRHLQTVLENELGLNLDGFFIFDARAISADGRIIAGYGFNKFGEQEAFVADLGNSRCYPDCDTSTGDGVLDLFDFLCYVNEFNAGADYADCTADGVLDLFDFLCFVNAFNEGC